MERTVAVISPDADTRKMIAISLELKGVDVVSFASPRELCAKSIGEKKLTVVIDMADCELTKKDFAGLRERRNVSKTVVILPRGESEFNEKEKGLLPDAVVRRPFELMRLVEIVLSNPRRSSSSRKIPRRPS